PPQHLPRPPLNGASPGTCGRVGPRAGCGPAWLRNSEQTHPLSVVSMARVGRERNRREADGRLTGTRRQFLEAGGRGALALTLGAQLAWLPGCGPGDGGKPASPAPDWDGLQKD